jgi:hypothetical protein
MSITDEQKEMRRLAAQIRDNKQLRHILKSAKPELRKLVYEEMKPHLSFTPKPYLLLK